MTYEPVRAAEPQVDAQLETQLPPRDDGQTPGPVSPLAAGEKPTIWRVLKDQRKALWVAVVLVVASFWVLGQLDRWTLGTSITIGVLLGVDQPRGHRALAAAADHLGGPAHAQAG